MKTLSIKSRRYLGSKAKLCNFIDEIIKEECGNFYSFLDLFAGTGVVSWNINDENHKVILNDNLESNYYSYIAFYGQQNVNKTKIENLIYNYNKLIPTEENYFSITFSNTYFSKENCLKIGYIRQNIEDLYSNKKINSREKAILITSLLYGMDRIANTVGHYDSFRANGDINKQLILFPLELPENEKNINNEIYCEDSNELVKKISADVIYIDPPYNSRQYCYAYHLLENVATWKKPKVFGKAKKMDTTNLKSKYCLANANLQFEKLISNLNAKYILVSYNDMGKKGTGRSQAKISDDEIIRILSQKGEVKIFEQDFNQFTTGKSKNIPLKERIFLCIVGKQKVNKVLITTNEDEYVKSPLNYTGGKFKLLSQITKRFPNKISTFVDLFGGGFNVGVNVEADKIIYNDFQKETCRLIKLFYKYDSSTIINSLNAIISKYGLSQTLEHGYEFYNCNSEKGLGSFNKIAFNELKKTYNNLNEESVEKDFLLLTLVIFSFNNQIRFNSVGHFNLPVGKRDLNKSVLKNIKEFANKIKTKKIKFYSKNFDKIFINEDDVFYYCDPPYYLGTASYNENNGWEEEDEINLLKFLIKLNKSGIKFALSNVLEHKRKKHTMLKKWADDNKFNIIYIKSDYSNSSYHAKNKDQSTIEVLITNY